MLDRDSDKYFEIERHRAAILRIDLSRPVRLAIETDILNLNTTFFDYGCGHGGDVERVGNLGIQSSGWDPYYFPNIPIVRADIVNLGYIINVIEDKAERTQAIQAAWQLTGKVLIVAAQVLINASSRSQIPYGDGIVTRLNTFQKYYQQEELKRYIDETIGVDAVPVALGIYFVFRDDGEKENFKASRFYSRASTPRICIPTKKFADYQEILAPLMEFYTRRGRLPVKGEIIANKAEIIQEFGSYNRAFGVILQATDEVEWDAIAYRRSLDIQVYLALSHFEERPRFRRLPGEMRHDIKAFFGSYEDACQVADNKLFSLGDPKVIKSACEKSKIGKHTRGALYVHVSALQELDPLLRIYEGCGTRLIGRIDGATLIKFCTDEPRISYLFYPDFDSDAHPALKMSIHIDLKTLKVFHQDYSERENPPVLHRKETFVTPDYPHYQLFAGLTQREEKRGLLANKSQIGTRKGWLQCLQENSVTIRGHRIFNL